MSDIHSSAAPAPVPAPAVQPTSPPVTPSAASPVGWRGEPVLIIVGGIGSVITAVIALIVAFGVSVTSDQQAAVLGVAAILTQLATAITARSKVTPSP